MTSWVTLFEENGNQSCEFFCCFVLFLFFNYRDNHRVNECIKTFLLKVSLLRHVYVGRYLERGSRPRRCLKCRRMSSLFLSLGANSPLVWHQLQELALIKMQPVCCSLLGSHLENDVKPIEI